MVFRNLTKNCWIYGIQYEVIIKDRLTLEIKLIGKREKVLLKFNKTLVVFKEDYNSFIDLVELMEVDKAYFITTGVFQAEIYKLNSWKLSYPKVFLEDSKAFLKRQIWSKKKYNEHLKYDKLDFNRYLPV
ncbi:hypothetical protein [Clostridium folliculivorans]|uniref:Uncharacterized protein n=1 Tax=Clostridium folliculivorans TaxID=2886038 RepID=A0A9W5Y4F3_9CLOT|nr:hypothetical protein [Clostridium folliculivorans]GKU26458.1 hypothetical protein CFOLD11_32850 [Clostridium folliculivorans]GKU31987.1 hypothetical protein CFB3_40950 [Clostridium folliculivorans]